ncbi:MAG: F0F1 ATP synthase subunit alpha, partial [Prosthecochloris sp.]|nr:F0F1 ATP synthase subunit alpha [Prosthecochloris sp.]
KLGFSQFEELENFARFGARLDEGTRKVLRHGERIRECFKQDEYELLTVIEQMMSLIALAEGYLDTIPTEKLSAARAALNGVCSGLEGGVYQAIESGAELTAADRKQMLITAEKALQPFRESL